MEEAVLLDEGLVAIGGACLLGLEGHVGVGDLGDLGHEEAKGQDEDEDGDGEVDPLDVLQGGLVVKGEEDVGAQDGGDDGADGVEGLGDVDADLGVLGGPADGDVGVGGRLEGAQAVADDEDAGAEAAEALCDDGGDGEQGADAVQEEAPDEDGAVAVVAQDPGGVAERGDGVCATRPVSWTDGIGQVELEAGSRTQSRRPAGPRSGRG